MNRDLRYLDPATSFTGFIDRAILHARADGSCDLELLGWLWAEEAAISELQFGLIDGQMVYASFHDRPDVATRLPESTHSRRTGFSVSLRTDSPLETYAIRFEAILANGRKISSTLSASPTPPRVENSPKDENSEARDSIRSIAQIKLKSFLRTGCTWEFPVSAAPMVTVIIPVHDSAALTLECLAALRADSIHDLEIVVIDNGSRDETSELLSKMEGVRMLHNATNLHYGVASNQGAAVARGELVLFLNNDAFVLPGAIASAVSTLTSDPTIGTVGAKLLRPDGKLQEVGSWVLPNGTTVARGRGSNPNRELYGRNLVMDYCSGAFLLTSKEQFLLSGGFSSRFTPAYYEDVEYCMRLAKRGLRCVVDANAEVLHLERGSAKSDDEADEADELMQRHRLVFNELFPFTISERLRSATNRAGGSRTRLLMLDDTLPKPSSGQGLARAALILDILVKLDFDVSFLGAESPPSDGRDELSAPHGVRLLRRNDAESEFEFLRTLLPTIDILFVSRPQHMEKVQNALRTNPPLRNPPVVIYDAEALQAKREILRLEVLQNTEMTDDEIVEIVSSEITLACDAQSVVTASHDEAQTFLEFGFERVSVLGFGVDIKPVDTPFADRAGLLTVGPLLANDTPNVDGLKWFVQNVFPWFLKLTGREVVEFDVVGENHVDDLTRMQHEQFRLLGFVNDLQPLYASRRVFIAPTRFAAGLPLKVIEAAASGIPIVATPLVASQLGWRDEQELLVGYNEQDFAAKCAALYVNSELWSMLRKNALQRVSTQFSMTKFEQDLRDLVRPFDSKRPTPP